MSALYLEFGIEVRLDMLPSIVATLGGVVRVVEVGRRVSHVGLDPLPKRILLEVTVHVIEGKDALVEMIGDLGVWQMAKMLAFLWIYYFFLSTGFL